METLQACYPDLETLTRGLQSVFREGAYPGCQLEILDRQPNLYTSTFPSEIVRCRIDGSEVVQLFCKYAAGQNHNVYGHRGGVAYEAEVYRHVLQRMQVTAAAFYGAYRHGRVGESWLILQYLEQGVRLTRYVGEDGLVLAVRWIAEFHRASEKLLKETTLSFLNRYTADYFLGWVQRTEKFAGHLHHEFQWLAPLCRCVMEDVCQLLPAAPTIIHGEYYPRNILVNDRSIYPIDWESAAVGGGEVDLVSLVEGWPEGTVQECKAAYLQARWPEISTANFDQFFDRAQLYLQFRWLGDRPEWTTDEDCLWRFEILRSTGERLGLIE